MSYRQSYPRSHASRSYNFRHDRHDPGLDISPQVLLPTVALGVLLVWTLLSSAQLIPSPAQTLIFMTTRLLGPRASSTLSALPIFRQTPRAPRKYTHDPNGTIGGLWNTGNTCYQNSVLQALASCESLPAFLELHGMEAVTATALGDLVESLNEMRGRRSDVPAPALTRTGKGWGWGEQQDAQEFLQGLFGELEKESAAAGRRLAEEKALGVEAALEGKEVVGDRGGIRAPFEGLVAQRVGCLRCGFVEGVSLQPFTMLSLPLPSARVTTVEECLEAYTSIEHIPDVECDKCTLVNLSQHLTNMRSNLPAESPLHPTITQRLDAINTALDTNVYPPKDITLPKNKTLSPKSKQLLISRAPPILILHLNRSHFNPHTGHILKNHAFVRFPLTLSLPVTGELRTAPLNETMCREMRRQGYRLKSVICHYGGHSSGHYICYRYWGDEWWRISDDEVERVGMEEVRGAGEAFMVFYEKEGEEEEWVSEASRETVSDMEGQYTADMMETVSDPGIGDEIMSDPGSKEEGSDSGVEMAGDPDIHPPTLHAPPVDHVVDDESEPENRQLLTPDPTPEPEVIRIPEEKENEDIGTGGKKARRRKGKKSTPLVAVN